MKMCTPAPRRARQFYFLGSRPRETPSPVPGEAGVGVRMAPLGTEQRFRHHTAVTGKQMSKERTGVAGRMSQIGTQNPSTRNVLRNTAEGEGKGSTVPGAPLLVAM